MTLREKLIEAGADAVVELIVDPARELSEAVLDAFLDCLAEDAESSKSVRHLVRVLRDPPTEEDR